MNVPRYSPTFDEVYAWRKQIVNELLEHHAKRGVVGERLEAIRAGAEQGISAILGCLRLHGAMEDYASK